jgi:gluconate 2-dehydrogenase gamma chain
MASRPTTRYPTGTVRALLETVHVSDATRAALRERLERPVARVPLFFTNEELVTLRAVCDRLIPQPDRAQSIDVAREIDLRLAAGATDGWRYDILPADGEMYRAFFAGLDAMARARGSSAFSALDDKVRDEILSAIQRGEVTREPWERLPADRCFEEILAEVAETFYGHPLAQEEIGYVGMADLPAWNRIGLDERDEREPRPLPST